MDMKLISATLAAGMMMLSAREPTAPVSGPGRAVRHSGDLAADPIGDGGAARLPAPL